MRNPLRTLVLALPLSILAACGGGANVAGTYALDVEAMLGQIPAMQQMPAEAKAKAVGMMQGQLVLNADHTARFVMKAPMKSSDDSGKWELAGDKLTLTKDHPGEGEGPMTGTLKDGVVTITDEEGGMKVTMTFRKQAK
ncbi:MAG: hypothetical protein KDE27_16120 [Planctomycetes bacterium]|nr:hypothetical protein [Planctomycetota bacterium]